MIKIILTNRNPALSIAKVSIEENWGIIMVEKEIFKNWIKK
jgi:hypothetical protein